MLLTQLTYLHTTTVIPSYATTRVCYLTPNMEHPPLAPFHSLTANIVKEGLCFVIEDLWFFFLFTFPRTSLISRVIFLLIFIIHFPITCNNRFWVCNIAISNTGQSLGRREECGVWVASTYWLSWTWLPICNNRLDSKYQVPTKSQLNTDNLKVGRCLRNADRVGWDFHLPWENGSVTTTSSKTSTAYVNTNLFPMVLAASVFGMNVFHWPAIHSNRYWPTVLASFSHLPCFLNSQVSSYQWFLLTLL